MTQETQREESLGKVYDLTLLRRLWRYVRPYRGQFFTALICLPFTLMLQSTGAAGRS